MELAIDVVVTLIGLGVVSAYIWSVGGHFSSPSTPRGAWMISAAVTLSTLLLLWLTWSEDQPAVAQAVGILIEALSIALFVAAIRASRRAKLRFAFDPTHPHGLVDSGPYRFVRHPFYVSYLLFWIGWSVAVWSPWVIVIPIVFLGLYFAAARMEERNFAASPLASEYDAYKRRVGFFVPRL